MGKILRDPTALGDLVKDEEAGVPTALTRIMKTATDLGNGNTKLRFGGACKVSKIQEVDLKLSSEDPKEKWQRRISEVGEGAVVVFTDGSKIEGGGVGASWWDQERRKGYGIGLGKIATVWDGEVAGLRGALTHAPAKKILILSDSQAAIAATKQAGRTGKARTYNLRWVASEIGSRKEELGEDAVTLGWVKAHVGIYGNEEADRLAKEGAEKTPNTTRITEGGLKQAWVKKRKADRCVKGTGRGGY
jgi:ribonuclease HI